jgi:hypothetical protein
LITANFFTGSQSLFRGSDRRAISKPSQATPLPNGVGASNWQTREAKEHACRIAYGAQ